CRTARRSGRCGGVLRLLRGGRARAAAVREQTLLRPAAVLFGVCLRGVFPGGFRVLVHGGHGFLSWLARSPHRARGAHSREARVASSRAGRSPAGRKSSWLRRAARALRASPAATPSRPV